MARHKAEALEIERYLRKVAKHEAQDLYLSVDALPVCKVGSKLVPLGEDPLTKGELKRLVAPFLEGPKLEAFRQKPEIDLAHTVPGVGRFRINIYLQRGQLTFVARRIKPGIPTLQELGMPSVLRDLAVTRQGLVCVTGSTGCGKSTTLAAMIDFRNDTTPGHILTIEDPIEFVHEHKASVVSQREVGRDTRSFKDALRAALRQAPDLLLLGEIRDLETAEAALHFAETGHLVLATLHATNAVQTLERLVHLFPPAQAEQVYMLLSLNLAGIVCQRLLPKRRSKERVAALEVLVPTPRIRDLIRGGDVDGVWEAMREAKGTEGMQIFDESLYQLARKGLITQHHALAYADMPNDLKLRFMVDHPDRDRGLERIRLARG